MFSEIQAPRLLPQEKECHACLRVFLPGVPPPGSEEGDDGNTWQLENGLVFCGLCCERFEDAEPGANQALCFLPRGAYSNARKLR